MTLEAWSRPHEAAGGIAADPAVPLQRLGGAERFVVWSLRRHAEGEAAQTSLQLGFVMAFGICRVEPGLAHLGAMMGIWQRHGRRPPLFGPRLRPWLGRDERMALALLAAVQAGRGGHAEALARFLVSSPAGPGFLAAAEGLAGLLAERGLWLSGPA